MMVAVDDLASSVAMLLIASAIVLLPSLVMLLIKRAAKACSLEKIDIDAFSAHSLHVGAGQNQLRNGHDTAAIMRAGGWKSVDVMARYLEFTEHNVWF